MNRKKRLRLQRKLKMAVAVGSLIYMVFGIKGYITTASIPADRTTKARPVITESPQPVEAEDDEGQAMSDTELEYPFNTMSFDWSDEQIEGFREYNIPEEYELYGGYFPVEMQQYTYIICKDYGVDYNLILAMIEVESGYRYDAVSSCNAVGYMQIIKEWHTDRMEECGVNNLKNPYQNVRIGIDYMAELLGQYQTSVALSVYNRGARNCRGTGAIDLADKGQYDTDYSEKVLARAAEIEKELAQ